MLERQRNDRPGSLWAGPGHYRMVAMVCFPEVVMGAPVVGLVLYPSPSHEEAKGN